MARHLSNAERHAKGPLKDAARFLPKDYPWVEPDEPRPVVAFDESSPRFQRGMKIINDGVSKMKEELEQLDEEG